MRKRLFLSTLRVKGFSNLCSRRFGFFTNSKLPFDANFSMNSMRTRAF